ncbi:MULTISPECIES: hypothetical protein [Aeromicrobium]|uniref:DUF2550 family protein n=1 Tax=Aeromicrobium erythreum TaxID=2041 RepID=A0A0U3TGN6_9ACTN|nr:MULTISPECIES: hypothetical protein [Aeromicrobium]ALX04743.1 hypothetical protein AERYTH_08560 [Aeromicrobium erythreum]
MGTLLAVLALVAGLVLLLVVVGLVRLALVRRGHRRRVAGYAPEVVEQAGLFAVASDRQTQVRGIGSLLLGREHLAFVPLVAGRDVEVPRDAITSATLSRTFLGRSTGADLLVVTWSLDGLADAAAFQVSDPAGWRDRLS